MSGHVYDGIHVDPGLYGTFTQYRSACQCGWVSTWCERGVQAVGLYHAHLAHVMGLTA